LLIKDLNSQFLNVFDLMYADNILVCSFFPPCSQSLFFFNVPHQLHTVVVLMLHARFDGLRRQKLIICTLYLNLFVLIEMLTNANEMLTKRVLLGVTNVTINGGRIIVTINGGRIIVTINGGRIIETINGGRIIVIDLVSCCS